MTRAPRARLTGRPSSRPFGAADLERRLCGRAGPPGDGPRERACREFGPGHEADEQSERIGRRRAQEMQARSGRLHAAVEHRVSVYATDPRERRRREERVTGDVDAIAGREQDVIDVTRRAVVEPQAKMSVGAG